MKVVLDHSQAEADNIRTFFFKPEIPVQFTAGQYAEWSLPHPHADKRGAKRWFTISSSPNEPLLSITTKLDAEKGSSFKKRLFQLQPGYEATLNGPFGDFVLPKLIQTPLIFVAGGIGITPFHSMLQWLAETNETRPIKLLYAVRSEDEIIFIDTFEKSGISPTIIVSEPSPAWGGERGRLDAEKIAGLTQPTEDALVYISGPEGMVQQLAKDLVKTGLDKKQVVTDEFPNYPGI